MENFKIGLSGIRGIVGETLSENTVFNLGLAFAEFCKGKILIGRDTRPSGKRFSQIIRKAGRKSGKEPLDLGILPTPTLLLAVKKMKVRGGIMITASHNPSRWNGLKLINSRGTFLDCEELKRFLIKFEKVKRSPQRKRGAFAKNAGFKDSKSDGTLAIENHIQTVMGHLNRELIRKRRFKVGIDPVNGAGVLVAREFLSRLNCQIFSINEKPNGKFGRPPEPLAKNLGGLSKLVKRHNLDLGFAQDPDADRLAIVSEVGLPIGEEYTLTFAFQNWVNRFGNKSAKRERGIVINLATTQMIEDIAEKAAWKVYRSKVGEVNVVTKMKEVGSSFGGEGNGGVICPSISQGRDTLVGMGLILELMAATKKTISELRKETPGYYRFNDRVKIPHLETKEVSTALKKGLQPLTKNYKVNFLDGIRMKGKDFWWLVRPSNTEPIIRIMGEAKTKSRAEALLISVKKQLKRINLTNGF